VKQLGESIEEKDGASRSLISMEWEEEVAGVRDLAACFTVEELQAWSRANIPLAPIPASGVADTRSG